MPELTPRVVFDCNLFVQGIANRNSPARRHCGCFSIEIFNLAEDNLTGNQWKNLRAIATERAAELTHNALAVRAKLSREHSQ